MRLILIWRVDVKKIVSAVNFYNAVVQKSILKTFEDFFTIIMIHEIYIK